MKRLSVSRRRLLLLAFGVALSVGLLLPAAAVNLLYNPAAEGAIGLGQGEAAPYDGQDAGWRLQNLSGSHMFSSPPPDKLSLHSGGTDPNTRYSQKIQVKPESAYTASVSVGLSGGTGSLEVQEFDSGDNPVGDAHSVSLPEPQAGNTGYSVVNFSTISVPGFTTDESTAYVEYRLNWTAPGGAVQVRWDDAVLDGDPSATATLSGTVTDAEGAPIEGATITAGTSSTLTDALGEYTLTGLPVTGGPIKVICTKDGFYDESSSTFLDTNSNLLDFEMLPPPANNLLGNSSFEDGIGPGFNTANEAIDIDPVNQWAVMGSSTSYWYINPNGYPHTGSLADGPYGYESFDFSQYQDIGVKPNSEYKAYVWMQPINLSNTGTGFGSDPADSAALWVQELTAAGEVVVDHGKQEVTTAQLDYVHKYLKFTTSGDTAKIRFRLHSKLTNTAPAFNKARFRYDTAVLDGQPAPSSVRDALSKPDGALVSLQGKVVSAAFLDFVNFEDYFYIQEPDRAAGIKVRVGQPTPGNFASVEGTIQTIDGERIIEASLVQEGSFTGVPDPLVTINRNTAQDADGVSLTGLYITAFGKVDNTGGNVFTIDDGSGAPLKVLGPEGFSATPGSYVAATGPLGAETSGESVVSVLRAVSVVD